MKNDISTELNC